MIRRELLMLDERTSVNFFGMVRNFVPDYLENLCAYFGQCRKRSGSREGWKGCGECEPAENDLEIIRYRLEKIGFERVVLPQVLELTPVARRILMVDPPTMRAAMLRVFGGQIDLFSLPVAKTIAKGLESIGMQDALSSDELSVAEEAATWGQVKIWKLGKHRSFASCGPLNWVEGCQSN